MNRQKGFLSLAIILIIIGAVAVIGGGGIVAYNYYSTPKSVVCTPNWQCGWGACTNGYQSQVAVDSNNCGVTTGNNIACTALARACTSGAQCNKDSDCHVINCIKAPCPVNTCVDGKCVAQNVQTSCQTDNDCMEISCPATGGFAHEKCVQGKCAFAPGVKEKCSGSVQCNKNSDCPVSPPISSCGGNFVCTQSATSVCESGICKKVYSAGCSTSPCPNGCKDGACIQSTTQPSITVTSPNGGENLTRGQAYQVGWQSQGMPLDTNVNVYINVGIANCIIGSGTASGNISFTLPLNAGGDCYYATNGQYRISVYAGGTGMVGSIAQGFSNYFTIVAP